MSKLKCTFLLSFPFYISLDAEHLSLTEPTIYKENINEIEKKKSTFLIQILF